ncbi:hypothetical protein [Aliivibrio fischeri]|uniref:hypothetical protein n=1 Tax=Aliivibrio fischeri TaxID=668 RepID=UPI00128FF8E2|nr:hypothetical protein [Aliivibrio fischeri]
MTTVDNVTKLISVLQEFEIIDDLTPLHQLSSTLRRANLGRGIGYQLTDLTFSNLSSEQFINSNIWDADSLEIKLHLNLKLKPHQDFCFGSVDESVVEVTYEALTIKGEIARGAWHLDFHDHTKGKQPKFIHPDFHFHHGGRRIKDTTENYGELVLLDAPRLMHPPLDLFLAIDMLITNFIEKRVWLSLRADKRYQEIIQNSQNKWWHKYYQQVADYWTYQTSGSEDVVKRNIARLSNPYLY